jgi:hypothetical protein
VLAADTIPRVRLTTIFRQTQESGVVVNAHRINAGQADFWNFTGCPPAGSRLGTPPV